MRYAIVKGYDLETLVDHVNEVMTKGLPKNKAELGTQTWVPHGIPFYTKEVGHGPSGQWHQVMLRM